MRSTVLLFALACAACGSGGSSSSCPSSIPPTCGADQDGSTCEVTTESGQAGCRCDGTVWTCNDCPDFAPPIGACSAGEHCSVWGFENACACSCDANGQWSCTVDDPSPNFHCAP